MPSHVSFRREKNKEPSNVVRGGSRLRFKAGSIEVGVAQFKTVAQGRLFSAFPRLPSPFFFRGVRTKDSQGHSFPAAGLPPCCRARVAPTASLPPAERAAPRPQKPLAGGHDQTKAYAGACFSLNKGKREKNAARCGTKIRPGGTAQTAVAAGPSGTGISCRCNQGLG